MKKVRNIPLILGDKKFFNIEDLKNDFNVNDILSSYKNDNLEIWLSHKYNDLAQENFILLDNAPYEFEKIQSSGMKR